MRRLIYALLVLMLSGCMSLPEKNAALLRFSAAGDSAKAKDMLDSGADINARNRYGDSPLHLAIKNAHTEMAELLVSRGANINAKGALDDTPLHVSVYQGKTNIIRLLRQKGADDDLLNRYGLKPAEMQALPEIEKKIVEAAQLLTPDGDWTDRVIGRTLYDGLRARQDNYLINSFVLQITRNPQMRLRVLILAIKVGISGSEEKLVGILMVYGDKSMAEDYLNSGSSALAAGGRSWATQRGYRIMTGPGSHRGTWGGF